MRRQKFAIRNEIFRRTKLVGDCNLFSPWNLSFLCIETQVLNAEIERYPILQVLFVTLKFSILPTTKQYDNLFKKNIRDQKGKTKLLILTITQFLQF